MTNHKDDSNDDMTDSELFKHKTKKTGSTLSTGNAKT